MHPPSNHHGSGGWSTDLWLQLGHPMLKPHLERAPLMWLDAVTVPCPKMRILKIWGPSSSPKGSKRHVNHLLAVLAARSFGSFSHGLLHHPPPHPAPPSRTWWTKRSGRGLGSLRFGHLPEPPSATGQDHCPRSVRAAERRSDRGPASHLDRRGPWGCEVMGLGAFRT